jgi:hypothetical protein
MQVVTLAATVGYLFLLGFLGGLLSRLRQADPDGALPWVAFASLLMFTTALNIAIGLDIAGGLLLRSTNGSATYTLHSAGFILAAPAALLGTAFFVAVAAVTFHTRVFPRATAWIAIVGGVLNVGALGGIVTLEGPHLGQRLRRRHRGPYRDPDHMEARSQCVVAHRRRQQANGRARRAAQEPEGKWRCPKRGGSYGPGKTWVKDRPKATSPVKETRPKGGRPRSSASRSRLVASIAAVAGVVSGVHCRDCTFPLATETT